MLKLLIAFMIATFAIGTEKFVVVGLLPNIAEYFDIPLGKASQIVTYYVFGITISGPIFAILLRNVNKKFALILLMLIFIIGNVIAFMAPIYEIVLLGRVIASFTHAPFIGIANSLISQLSDGGGKSSRVGMVFTGMTVANIIGIPLGTIIGDLYGWQATFKIITVIGILTLISLLLSFKDLKITSEKEISQANFSLISEIKAILGRPQIIITFLITIANFTSLYLCFTFLKVILTDFTGLSKQMAGYTLSLFGIGATIGTILGGNLYNIELKLPFIKKTNLIWTISGSMLMIIAALIVSFLTRSHYAVSLAIFLFGFCTFLMVPFLQSRTIEKSSGLSSFSSILHVASFNLGSGLGSSISGILVTQGLGLLIIPLFVLIPSSIAIILAILALYVKEKHI